MSAFKHSPPPKRGKSPWPASSCSGLTGDNGDQGPEELGAHRRGLLVEPAGGGQHPSAPPQQRRQLAALPSSLPFLFCPRTGMTWQTDSLPPQRPGSACPKPAPRAPSKQGGPGPAGLPPPRVRMRGAALPPSDTAGPCGVERRGVREGEQLANTTPYNLGLLPRGGGRPWGSPPARRARSLSPTGVRLGSAMGKGQMLSATTPQLPGEERSSLPGTGRGGEEGREGRRTTAPSRQTARCLGAWGYWRASTQETAPPGPAASLGLPRAPPLGTWHPGETSRARTGCAGRPPPP